MTDGETAQVFSAKEASAWGFRWPVLESVWYESLQLTNRKDLNIGTDICVESPTITCPPVSMPGAYHLISCCDAA